MSNQSTPTDFEVAELEKDMPKQLKVDKPNPQDPESKKDAVDSNTNAPRPAQLATPDSTLPDDHSDIPSQASRDSSMNRRKHRRGGRKQRQQSDLASQTSAHQQAEHERERFEEQEGRGKPAALPELKHRNSNNTRTRKATGIKTFNLKRAESSGGRAFGVSVEESNGESKKVRAPKVKPKNKSRRRVKCDKCGRKSKTKDEDANWESDDNDDDDDDDDGDTVESEESEEEEQKQEEPKKQKPFAIRLDLNLELEIFLRAKIKGDVTITFL